MRGIICTRQENKISKILLCFVSLLISTQAFTLEIEAPAILLTNVPAEFGVSTFDRCRHEPRRQC
jgi:hypothetical protein